MAGTIRTGMAGWVFPEWRGGTFYPEGLKQKEELALGQPGRHRHRNQLHLLFKPEAGEFRGLGGADAGGLSSFR